MLSGDVFCDAKPRGLGGFMVKDVTAVEDLRGARYGGQAGADKAGRYGLRGRQTNALFLRRIQRRRSSSQQLLGKNGFAVVEEVRGWRHGLHSCRWLIERRLVSDRFEVNRRRCVVPASGHELDPNFAGPSC